LALLDEADSIAKWSGLEVVAEPVQTGKAAARWTGAGTGAVAKLEPAPADWGAYNCLCLDLHASNAQGTTFVLQAVSDPEGGTSSNYFLYMLKVDWDGWRKVRIPFASFSRARQPEGWRAIDSVVLHSRGWNIEPKQGAVLHMDNMRLEYSEKLAKRKQPPPTKHPHPDLKPWTGALRFPDFPWSEVFAFAEQDEQAGRTLADILKQADNCLDDPITTRKFKLDDIPENQRDGRYKYAGKNAEVFALAMHDCRNGGMLARQMVPLALAARRTDRKEYIDWVNRQLAEVATWSPLQRPGWTQYNPDATLPPGGDGNWLATGYCMKAIVHTLELMGDRVPADLQTKLRALLQKEIESIQDDWTSKRPWFVRSDYPATNQWVLPNAAMLYACLYLGDDRNRAAYDMGVHNLARTCLAQGEDGSWSEGLSYGSMSAEYLFWAAWALVRNGDERLLDYGFARNFNDWLIHMAMPGGYCVNAFDCGRYQMGTRPDNSFMLSALLVGKPESYWAGEHLFRQVPSSFAGLLFRYYSSLEQQKQEEPKPFAFFPHQQVLTWRSNWDRNHGMGLWIRGGSMRDSHCHRDNGHISVYNGTTPILIEAGTPSYADRELPVKYSPAAGHNILQPAAAKETNNRGRHTPLTVKHLNETGGEVVVDGTNALPGVDEWMRTIAWERAGRVSLTDRVTLGREVEVGAVLFRFHTGSPKPVTISGDGYEWIVRWEGVTLALSTNRQVRVDQTPWPDRSGVKEHACVRLHADQPIRDLKLSTLLSFAAAKPKGADAPSYRDYLKSEPDRDGKDLIVLQAEDMVGDDERFTVSDKKVGAERCVYNWNDSGQTLGADVLIKTGGWYRIFLKCCTGTNFGIPVRSLAIDGKTPFREAAALVFPDTGGWSNERDDWELRAIGQDVVENGFRVYLRAGMRRLEFTNEEGGGLNVDYIVVHPASMAKAQARQQARRLP
jgi:hypothetical protein